MEETGKLVHVANYLISKLSVSPPVVEQRT